MSGWTPWRGIRQLRDEPTTTDARPVRRPTSHKPPAKRATAAQTVAKLRADAPIADRWVVDTNHGHLHGEADLYSVRHTGTGETHHFGTDREGAHLRAHNLNKAAEPHGYAPQTVDRVAAEREFFLRRADELMAKRTELEARRARLYDECRDLWNAEQGMLGQAEDCRHLLAHMRYGDTLSAAPVEADGPQVPLDDDPDGVTRAYQAAGLAAMEAALDNRPDVDDGREFPFHVMTTDAEGEPEFVFGYPTREQADEHVRLNGECYADGLFVSEPDPMPPAVAENAKAAFAQRQGETPEALTAAPASTGPATVPQFQPRRGDERTLPLPVNEFLASADGTARRPDTIVHNGEEDTVTFPRANGAQR